VLLDGHPLYTRVQRLTNRQWEHAVTDVLRFSEVHGLSKSFARTPSDESEFDNNERALFVGQQNFLDFEAGAEAAAALATGSPAALAAMYDGDDAAGFVATLGRRAFRRPLTALEQKKYEQVFALGERIYGAGFANGAALVVRAIFQSPHFLYRTELGASGEPLNGYELASKLSFWLLGTTPSDALLDAAEAGDLDSDAGLASLTKDLLADPRAIETMRDFHEQLLAVQQFEAISKAGVPEYDAAINGELVLASDAFFDRLFEQNLGLGELLTSQHAYVGPGLAPFYGMSSPGPALQLRTLGSARAGFFMQVPFLMLTAENAESDPARRALFLQKMTCGPVTPLNLEPLGWALESFDGLGRERDSKSGLPLDTGGSYPFAEGVSEFADGKELMAAMASSTQVHTCYARKLTSYALGRDLVEADRPLLRSLAEVSLNDSLRALALSLVQAPAFRVRTEVAP
jgi:hypothetical protein